jgi:hypothetical protein
MKVAQLGSPFTVCAKAKTSSWMHVEYCATVALQPDVGIALQPGFSVAAAAVRQLLSASVQVFVSTSCVGALLDVALLRPCHLQAIGFAMALPK